jgi:site-specific DNA recombinase
MKFGAFIRVSTDPQKIRGESLKVQKAQLESSIESLKGEIVDWYGGSESATPNKERAELSRLMQDALSGKINGIMVADTLRWSRDNYKSHEYINLMKENGIKFFIQSTEQNLFDPMITFSLGVAVQAGQMQAEVNSRKGILSKISRSERNIPCSGKLPRGRTFNKKTAEWAIIPEEKKRIEEIADLYLKGNISWKELGKKFSINPTHLREVMLFTSGDKWPVEFKSKKFNIYKKWK